MIPGVTPEPLLLIAEIVWMVAGGSVLGIGISDVISYWQFNNLLLL